MSYSTLNTHINTNFMWFIVFLNSQIYQLRIKNKTYKRRINQLIIIWLLKSFIFDMISIFYYITTRKSTDINWNNLIVLELYQYHMKSITLSKISFSKKHKILSSKKLHLNIKKRLIKLYIWSVVTCVCETYMVINDAKKKKN